MCLDRIKPRELKQAKRGEGPRSSEVLPRERQDIATTSKCIHVCHEYAWIYIRSKGHSGVQFGRICVCWELVGSKHGVKAMHRVFERVSASWCVLGIKNCQSPRLVENGGRQANGNISLCPLEPVPTVHAWITISVCARGALCHLQTHSLPRNESVFFQGSKPSILRHMTYIWISLIGPLTAPPHVDYSPTKTILVKHTRFAACVPEIPMVIITNVSKEAI